jgi:hypothetical protein
MSRGRKKLATDQIAITQDVLADVFIGPMSARMIESTKEYLKTGKFLDLRSEMQLSLRALWDRTMFAGIADAEFEIDNVKRNREPDIGFNLNSFSNLIEFNREDELRDELVNLNETLEIAKATNSLSDITRIEGEIGQTLAKLQGIQERKQNPQQARKKTKVLDLSKRATQVVNPKPDPISTGRVVRLEEQGTDLLRNETKEERKRRLIRDLIQSKRTDLGKTVKARNNFDPVNSREELRDPYKDLYVKESRSQTARNRLKQMEALQMWATLNDRYPAIGQESEFAQTYLNRRVQTVANDLDRKYQEDVKQTIAEYVKKDPQKRSGNKVLEEIKKIYLSERRERYGLAVENLKAKRNETKLTNAQFLRYLESQTGNSEAAEEIRQLQNQIEDLGDQMARAEGDEFDSLAKESDILDSRLSKLLTKQERSGTDGNLLKRISAVTRRINQNGENERFYTDPNARVNLTKKERSDIAILLGMTEEIERDKKGRIKKDYLKTKRSEFINSKEGLTAKELSFYITRLNAKAGRVDDKLISTVAKVATTEVSAAYNIGRLQSYLDRGVKYVQWISTIDSRTSEFCWSMHERIFPLNELLAQNMGKQSFPNTRLPEYHPKNQQIKSKSGLSMWVPPSHANCRSFLTPIYTDQKTDLYPPELPPTSDLGEAFINRQRLEDKDVRKLIKRQERELQDKIDRLGINIDELHDLFDNGLKFLTRRIRESEPQLAKFTPEDIRKNDKALVNALLTGGVVLGTGAMMYFFVKSNLGNKLQQYVKTSATGVLGGLVTNGLSNDAISNYLKNLIRQDRRLRDLPETTQLLLPSADEIDQLQNDESVIQQVNDNAIKSETVLELAARGEYNPQLLASAGATPGKILTNTQRDMKMIANLARTKRDLAFRRVEPLISQMFSNASFKVNSAPGSFTLGDINKITRFDKVYHVVASRAGSTFISRKGFDAVVGNPKYREQLQRYVSELDDIETALNNLDDYMEKADPLTKANFGNEKAQVAKAKNLINYALNQNNIENAADSLTENLDRLTNRIATNENLIETIVQTEGQINEIADRLIKDLDKVMPSNRLLDNLIVSEVSDVAELRKVQKLVKSSLVEIRKDFLTKNQSYTLGTAARKRDSTLSERYVQAVTDVENRTLQLNQSGLTYDNNVANIEQYFKDQVNERAQRLINLNNEITNRINELK